MTDAATSRAARIASRLNIIVVLLATLALAGLALCVFFPIRLPQATGDSHESRTLPPLPHAGQDLQPLLVAMAGNNIIRPAQVQAAVKDDGAAQRLLAKLNLQGVIQMGDDLVAYIQVEKGGVQTVKQGGSIIGLTVEKVEPSRVTLSLQGVLVTLGK